MPEDEGQTQAQGGRERRGQGGRPRGGRGKGAGPQRTGDVVGDGVGAGGEAQARPSQQPPQQRLRQRRLQAASTAKPQLPPQQQQEQAEQEEERQQQQQQQPEKQKTTDAFRVKLRRSEHGEHAALPATGAGPEPPKSRARHKMLKQRAAPSLPAAMTTAPTPPPQTSSQQGRTDADAATDADVVPEEPESVQLGSRIVCIICDGVLPTKEALSSHVKEQGFDHAPPCSDVEGYFCRVCRRVFDTAGELERHVLTHPDEEMTPCPLCGQPLRTNGEIHRHARLHARQLSNVPGVLPSVLPARGPKRRHAENNNLSSEPEDGDEEVEAKRWSPSSLEGGDEEAMPVGSAVLTPSPSPSRFTCPVCPSASPFRVPYLPELEAHLEQCHRDYSVPCDLCDNTFKSVRDLNLHRYSAHRGKARQRDVVGFKDLTFVDFSSQKFPQIAAAECEKSLHRPSSRQHPFQCECGRAFPCDSALAIHRQACPHTVYVDAPADLSRANNNTNATNKNSIHASLLGSGVKQPLAHGDTPPASDNKGDFFAKLDLLNSKSTPSSSPVLSGSSPVRDLADIQSMLSVSAGLGLALGGQDPGEEEQEDAFAAEFRRMKQRGEFPCLLCPEKFPNLRALKGHNRVHMSAPGPDGYRCNMCPHAAVDKVALQRHMRNHNGDRPYECALCRFAFTTKANCERHLRNRHDKRSREEVKRSIIYHPSEDPGNDPDAKLDVKLDAKRALFADPPEQRVPSPACQSNPASLLDMEPLRRPSLDAATMTSEDEADRQSPLDLSMVLDLSKKRPPTPSQEDEDPEPDEEEEEDVDEEDVDDEQPQDLSRKSTSEAQTAAPSPSTAASLLSQEALPFPALGPLYVNPYPVGVPQGVAPFPAYYPQLPSLLRSLQLGGGLVLEPMRLLPRTPVAFLANGDSPATPPVAPPSLTVSEPGVKEVEASSRASMPASPKSERSSASDSHQQGHSKMVMKNGVLMPKQKQRRYRTERPHVCEHCSARFTLSSNRERHVKQQHPQVWSQRHRGPLVARDAVPSTPPLLAHAPAAAQVVSASLANSIPAHFDAERSKSRHEEDEEDEGLVIDEERPQNADQLDDGAEGDAEDECPPPSGAGPAPGSAAAGEDLASVSRLLDNASTQTFRQFFRDGEEGGATVVAAPQPHEDGSEDEEEGLVAAGSPSDGNNSGSEEKSECESNIPKKKKSAYSLAPNRVSCPYCSRKFPWSSSLRRHILTHTGQKPYKCSHCPLLFTTKSNCDRHLARKHSNKDRKDANTSLSSVSPTTLSVTPNSSSTSISPGLSPPETDVSANTPLSPQNYQLRNVPDRPYKCRHCPSSTFATLSNLRKHVASKHTGSSVESCVLSFEERRAVSQSGYESHSSVSDELEHIEEKPSDLGIDIKMEVAVPVYNSNIDSQPLSLCKSENVDSEVKLEKRTEIKQEIQPLSLCKSQEPDLPGNNGLTPANSLLPISAPVVSIPEGPVPRPTDTSVILSSSELPFKCHLCDGSFTERQECLDHIRLNHASEYEVLLSKGALELSVATSPEDNNNDDSHPADGENIEHLRGKFPDYANRKVMCAFCMHRFWSAEDLRRHMRTHTGERPFFCDVCFKRFTLKHSMLRHWRKHRDLTNNNTNNNNNNNNISVPLINSSGAEDLSTSAASGDEEGYTASLRNISSRDLTMDHVNKLANHNNNNINLTAVSKMLRAWSENHNHVNLNKHSLRRRDEEDNGLISNLLGIGDPAIIDKVLITKSADDAEKILGVFKNNKRT